MSNPELTRRPSPLDRKARQLIRATESHSSSRQSAAMKLSRALGWFSVGLGLLQTLAATKVARATGLRGQEHLLRACGVRELASGVGLLASRGPRGGGAAVYSRIAGDAVDLALLGAAAARTPAACARPLAAFAAVAGVTALDLVCAQALHQQANAASQTTDYSDRSGIRPVSAAGDAAEGRAGSA